MAISKRAQQNHDELFPGHVSTLKVSDPELIEYFDNFAFDEVLRHGFVLYDALYRWCRELKGETHSWPPKMTA